MPNVLPILKQNSIDYTASGAINPRVDVARLTKGGVGAMTLVAPGTELNGHVMKIVSETAQAHTVTVVLGFGGVGSGGDVATWGGAIGDSLTIVADNGFWYDAGKLNVTFG